METYVHRSTARLVTSARPPVKPNTTAVNRIRFQRGSRSVTVSIRVMNYVPYTGAARARRFIGCRRPPIAKIQVDRRAERLGSRAARSDGSLRQERRCLQDGSAPSAVAAGEFPVRTLGV